MLEYACAFLVFALLTAIVGFARIAAASAGIAKILSSSWIILIRPAVGSRGAV